MIQGDEPMITPLMIETALEQLKHDEEVNVVNLISPIKKIGEFKDPNEVKVVTDLRGNALVFLKGAYTLFKKIQRSEKSGSSRFVLFLLENLIFLNLMS